VMVGSNGLNKKPLQRCVAEVFLVTIFQVPSSHEEE